MEDSGRTFGNIVKLKNRPSLDILNKLIKYDPLTGELIAKVDFGKKRKESILGGKTKAGLVISLSSNALEGAPATQISSHHLAYALTWGEWCKHSISHKDGDLFNNKWENLIVNKGIGIKDNRIRGIKETEVVEKVKTVEKPDLLRCDRSALIDYILLMEDERSTKDQLNIRIEELKGENKQLRKDMDHNLTLLQNIYGLACTTRG